jgi:hypothetical protein
MSGLGDIFNFEKFQLKDWWRKAKDNPEQLLIGAGTPIGAKAWSKVTGKDYEPFVDQMGGAYGGHAVSAFGQDDGGVYKRAREAGIDTKRGGQAHDLAHVVSAFYGGQGLMGLGGGGAPAGGSGSGQGLGIFSNGGTGGMAGVGQGNVGTLAANTGINTGGVAGVGGTGASAGQPMWQQMMSQGGLGSMPGMSTGAPPQQPPPQYQPPQQQMQPDLGAQANAQVGSPNVRPPMGSRVMDALGKARDGLTPIDPRAAAGMSPEQIKEMRNQAMLRMGLGMMASAQNGGRFGEALASGYGLGQAGLDRDVKTTYDRGVEEREQKRRDDILATDAQRYGDERSYRRERDSTVDARLDQNFDADQAYRAAQLQIARARLGEGAALPAGYRRSANGDLEFIPGGPADPNVGKRSAKPTEYDRKARLLFSEMVDAEQQYNDVAGKGEASVWDSVLDSSPMTRVFTSEEFRQREAAGLRWAQNFLYLKSGASATNEEVRKTFVQYLPQPGDTEAVIEQKATARQQAMGNVASANNLVEDQTPAAAPPPGGGPSVGTVEDGYRFTGGDPANPASWVKL